MTVLTLTFIIMSSLAFSVVSDRISSEQKSAVLTFQPVDSTTFVNNGPSQTCNALFTRVGRLVNMRTSVPFPGLTGYAFNLSAPSYIRMYGWPSDMLPQTFPSGVNPNTQATYGKGTIGWADSGLLLHPAQIYISKGDTPFVSVPIVINMGPGQSGTAVGDFPAGTVYLQLPDMNYAL